MTFAPFKKIVAGFSRGAQKNRLIALVVVVLGAAFLTIAILSYAASRERLRDLIVSKELPLTSEIVYTEIQRDFAPPLDASRLMASDTFLRDWATGGEKDVGVIQRYLAEMQRVNSAFTAYFVSDATHRYYTPAGILKTVSRGDSHDGWFFDLETLDAPYIVEVDTDQNHNNTLTVFINYRVFDDRNHFLGVVGLGLTVDAVRRSLDRYQREFDLETYFVDRNGKVMMSGDALPFKDIAAAPGLSDLAPKILKGQSGAMEYGTDGETHLLNVRYMPELNWYVFVERIEEAAMRNIRRTLYINLLIAAAATALVAALLAIAVSRFHLALDRLATTDELTHLTNRRAFNIILSQASKASRRANRRTSLVLFDIDHFQRVNAKYGHDVGDLAIKAVSEAIDSHARANDVVARWGGDEILFMLQDCGLDKAMGLADEIRRAIEGIAIPADGQTITVTVSAGAAEIGANETEDAALARVDEGLNAAKRAGYNCVISSNRF